LAGLLGLLCFGFGFCEFPPDDGDGAGLDPSDSPSESPPDGLESPPPLDPPLDGSLDPPLDGLFPPLDGGPPLLAGSSLVQPHPAAVDHNLKLFPPHFHT